MREMRHKPNVVTIEINEEGRASLKWEQRPDIIDANEAERMLKSHNHMTRRIISEEKEKERQKQEAEDLEYYWED